MSNHRNTTARLSAKLRPTPSETPALWRRRLLLSAVPALTMLAIGPSACAGDDSAPPRDELEPAPVPAPAASEDSGAVDAGGDGDASSADASCDDCEYFATTCSADVLCPNGLFDPSQPQGGADQFDGRTTIHLIRGTSENDVWVLGGLGAVAHFDGTSWVRSTPPLPDLSPQGLPPTLRTLWLRSEQAIGITGFDELYTHALTPSSDLDAGADDWTRRGPLSPAINLAAQTIMSGWSPPGSETFWMVSVPPVVTTRNRPSVLRLRATGSDTIGGAVVASNIGTFLSVHGPTADELWAVGTGGVTLRVTGAAGNTPTTQAFDSQTRNALYGVWAASSTEAGSVGFAGTIRHYTGDPLRWDVVPGIAEELQLSAVWGTSPSDVWAVGKNAVVLHYDGTQWTRVKIAGLGSRRPDLTSVWASDPNHVWIGGQGVVLSFGGKP